MQVALTKLEAEAIEWQWPAEDRDDADTVADYGPEESRRLPNKDIFAETRDDEQHAKRLEKAAHAAARKIREAYAMRASDSRADAMMERRKGTDAAEAAKG